MGALIEKDVAVVEKLGQVVTSVVETAGDNMQLDDVARICEVLELGLDVLEQVGADGHTARGAGNGILSGIAMIDGKLPASNMSTQEQAAMVAQKVLNVTS